MVFLTPLSGQIHKEPWMAKPYLWMVVLYLSLAVLAALGSSLAAVDLLPFFSGLRWLRVHFITLGVFSQAAFGLLPTLVATRARLSRPQMRWDIWSALNAGLVVLAVGMPLLNAGLIITGGALVFAAAVLLVKQLMDLRAPAGARFAQGGPQTKFYLAGLGYLLLGIIVGTGLFLGWGALLRMQVPREVHVHANLWGFTALVFAGLWVDWYPRFAKRPFAFPRSIDLIFWMMTIGELGLVVGPWVGSNWIIAPGLVLHFASTLLLLANTIKPLWGDRAAWSAGMFHLFFAYLWVASPAMLAPFIIVGWPGFPADAVEAIAPPMMVYGWLAQFVYGILPYVFAKVLVDDGTERLGGNRFSLVTVNLGALFILASAFLQSYAAVLNAVAFVAWMLSILPITQELWRIWRAALAPLDRGETGGTVERQVIPR